jgi:CDP-glycerol glycerophosphotransferase
VVFYDSFGGMYSDNPRAIFEELSGRGRDFSHVWAASDPAPFPRGTRTVRRSDAKHLRALGRAKYLVVNAQMPGYVEKKRGAVYLQTWHGTPLKRIGFDNPQWSLLPAGLREFAREIARWDYLISQNRFSTDIFRQAFRYEGEILETGYPRNDVLSSPDRDAIAKRVRTELGIKDGLTAVLYAPTWRDDVVDGSGRRSFSLELDVDLMERALGEDHVLLLRLHHAIPPAEVDAVKPFVRNVSGHPDIRELYLAADVLLTDYSSAMFDFAVTGKPVLFFTYDLDTYRDDVRGFYLDFERDAPGPLLTTTDEVIDSLRDLGIVAAEHAGRYAAFRARYCHFDDGRAAARIVDRVFLEATG